MYLRRTSAAAIVAAATTVLSFSADGALAQYYSRYPNAGGPKFDRGRAVGPLIVTPRLVDGLRPGRDRPPRGKDEDDDKPPKKTTDKKPPVRIVCDGGKVMRATCICPPGEVRRSTGAQKFACETVVVDKPPKRPPVVVLPDPPRVVTDPKPTPPPGAGGGRVVTPASPPVVRGVPSSGPVPVAPPATVAALGGEVMPNEVIVTVAPNAPATAEEDMARRYNVEIVERTTLPLVGLRAMRCRWSAQRPVQSVIGRMQSDPRTIDVQANYIYRPSQTASTAAAPNDLQYALAKLGLGDAQVLSAGHGTRIAIIDSGIDSKHPELLGALVETFDALGGEAEPGTHGTAIAGIIAARGTLRGIAPGATLMAVRAFPSDRSKQPQMTTSFVLLKALEWSITNGARVLNLSLSGPRDPLMEKAVSMAAAKGVIIVAAAGNNGDKAPPAYPAAYKDVIAVTAIDARDQIYTRANRGRYIAVAAPGVDVLSLVRGKGHDLQTGTSFAAAHVSGIVALMIERNPALTVGAARKALMESAIDLGEPGTDEAFGAGRTSAAAALKLVTP